MPSLQFDPLIYAYRHALSPGPSPVVPPISRLAHRLLHASNTVFKKRAPPSDFWPLLLIFGPPAATSWRRVWLSPVHFLYHVLRSFVFFSLCLFDLQLLFLNTCQKVINGVGWLDERHGLSPILYDTAPVFVYADQLLCHCVSICSNFR